MLKLVLSTDWVALRDYMLQAVSEDVAAGAGNRIYMVPELNSHDTERRLCHAAGAAASRFAEVLSFSRLGRRVSEMTGQAEPECLDNGGRLACMASAIHQLHSKLKMYASIRTKPEFLLSLVEAVDEWKRCCICAEDLRQAGDRSEGIFAQKLEELSYILAAYDSICARGKRDPRDRETVLLEQLQECDFAKEHVFYIEGFPDFTRQHLAILGHFIENSPTVTVGLNCDTPRSGAMAFEKAGQTAWQLIQIANEAGIGVEIVKLPGRENEILDICHGLFQGDLPKNCKGLQAFRADSAYDEVTVVAEDIQDMVRQGVRYRDIGLVCGDLSLYRDVVELVFAKYDIPLYRSGTEDILQSVAISTVLAALEAALGGFEQRAVLRYLRSHLSPLDRQTCDLVENYAVTWGIQGQMWRREWKYHPEGLNQAWTEADERRLTFLNNARAGAMEALEILAEDFHAARNMAQQVQALYDFLRRIDLAGKLAHLAKQMQEAKDFRSAQILNQLWQILLSALEQLHDMLGETVWEPEHFVRLFTLLLSQYTVGTIPPVLDAVTFGPVSAQRCQQVKHLYVLGVSEGAMPGYGGSKGLFSDQERTALRELGVPLTGGAMEGIQAEFAEIYGVFCGAEETITVSCPQGQPSYLFRRLAQMAGREQNRQPSFVDHRRETLALRLAAEADFDTACRLDLQQSYAQARQQLSYELGQISRENVHGLYGDQLQLSASQIDQHALCRMAYFLKYGLRARERKEATVDPAEFGTYVHAVLEETAREVMALGGFSQVSLEKTMDIAMKHSENYAREHFGEMTSDRARYLFRRNRAELEMVVGELWEELKQSRFLPDDFELQFGNQGKMDAIVIPNGGMPATIRGFVDRVDVWRENGRNYFRVVDYKTGKKDFDYCDVYCGVGLQMLLYLFALEQGQYGTAAGVQYFPARAPLISVDGKLSPEEAQALRIKEWKRKGLLLADEDVLDAMDPQGWLRLSVTQRKDGAITGDIADRQQLRMLRSYVFKSLAETVSQIASGRVEANPYSRGVSFDACGYCPYSSVCHKESVTGRRNYKALKPEEFWAGIEKEVGSHG